MSVGGEFFRFAEGDLQEIDIALADPLTVADSWLVADGSVRGLDRHFNRFASSITDPASIHQLSGFFDAVSRLLPREGNWFPRIEYREDQPEGARLFFRIRPAPERTETCTLWTLPEADPRVSPYVKGPDLSLCQQIRRMANLHGADEAVFLNKDGFVADGSLSAIVWWRGDVLEAPDENTSWLPSITRDLVMELAIQAGFQTREVMAKPADLKGCEVWSLSSLQGIRGVTGWGDLNVGDLRRLGSFRKRLGLLSQPVS